jgi:hypothetical protein
MRGFCDNVESNEIYEYSEIPGKCRDIILFGQYLLPFSVGSLIV